ncbi:MORN repeat-containing protein 2-like [Oscarella lobularis]|uniref:MORN repeat-containing protein 2-like n=1 Tax=Oscarella lobularis TaxID=121494 RepID=UPI003313698E
MPGKDKKSKGASNVSSDSTQVGVYVFANGEKYEGEYRACEGFIERDGKGTQYSTDGSRYTGDWVKDEMHGSGTAVYASGSAYEGNFSHNEYCGEGTYIWPDGSCLKGMFKNGKPTGQGEFIDSKGRAWSGNITGKLSELRLKLT